MPLPPPPLRDGYCSVDDLLLGDMTISSAISPAKFVADTADEIDVRISRIYVVPIQGDLTPPSLLVLKLANARLASGRMLMAQAQAAQDTRLHQYAMYLIREANATIDAIETNRLPLEGALIRDDVHDTPTPSIKNVDSASPVDAFYNEFMTGRMTPLPESPIWRPGV
jgi:hypothetical protein